MSGKPTTPARAVRCAIYTRKSTEEGLEKAFNSLDAQREAGEAYVKSQTHEGWLCLPTRYDDGGFSGGTLDRATLQRLLTDVRAGQVDVILIYKIDRLSRSLLDFAKLMEVFDEHRVAFVSITQLVNSATSMGRLMLNVLLSFAQFEREIIAERTRDKIAAARRKGKWSGGMPLLGYDVDPQGGKLLVSHVSVWARLLKIVRESAATSVSSSVPRCKRGEGLTCVKFPATALVLRSSRSAKGDASIADWAKSARRCR